eukprot:gene41227-25507_t
MPPAIRCRRAATWRAHAALLLRATVARAAAGAADCEEVSLVGPATRGGYWAAAVGGDGVMWAPPFSCGTHRTAEVAQCGPCSVSEAAGADGACGTHPTAEVAHRDKP